MVFVINTITITTTVTCCNLFKSLPLFPDHRCCTVPGFQQSADGLSPCKLYFSPNDMHADFVVNKVSLVESFSPFPVSVIPPVLINHSFAYHRLCTL